MTRTSGPDRPIVGRAPLARVVTPRAIRSAPRRVVVTVREPLADRTVRSRTGEPGDTVGAGDRV